MKTFAIHTLGCKVNSYESEAYINRCLELGYTQVDFKEKADIYLINTCAVTNTASSKSRQKINQAVHQNENAYIAVIGCYSQTVNEIENVHAIVGSDHKDEFLNNLEQFIENKEKVNYVHDLKEPVKFEDLNIEKFSTHTRAFLKVQDGCNQFCSYCIIPYTRGRERSLEVDRILELSRKFVENGHHEIVLAGIHTGRYGRDLNTNLTDLLKKMLEINGLDRIRISSIEMNEITDELIDLMKNNERIAHHLHIPIQTGSNEILKKMNRPYNIDEFKERVKYIRSQIPDISISTDIIAGFPTESDEHHEETLNNVKEIAFSFMHVFPYSKRDKTIASKMSQVHGTIKKNRARQLNEYSSQFKVEYYQTWINKTCKVLVEKCVHGKCEGYSSEYIPVSFDGNEDMIGKCIPVRIESVNETMCLGSLEE